MALPPELIDQLTGRTGARKSKIKDSIMFPKEHTHRLLELAEESSTLKGKMGYHAARLAMWKFAAEKLPICAGKNCSINTRNARYVMIEIHSQLESYKVGDKDDQGRIIVGSWEFPKESHQRLFELADADSASEGPLARYELWDYIAGLVPAVDASPGASFSIRMDNSWMGLLQVEDSDD